MTTDASHWSEANRECLMAAIGALRAVLEHGAIGDATAAPAAAPPADIDPPAAFERLRTGFGLSPFELGVVLLAAGIELDPGLADLVGAAAGGGVRPTVGFALRALPEAYWQALVPDAALRRWHLIELGHADTFTATPFRVSERTLHFLLGADTVEPRLRGLVEQVDVPAALPESYRRHAERIAERWGTGDGVLCLDGDDPAAVRAVAAAGCAALGLRLHSMAVSATVLPADERETLQRLWEREALFCQSALLVDDDTAGDTAALAAAHAFVRGVRCPVVAASRLVPAHGGPPVARMVIDPLTVTEQRALWQHALGPAATSLNGRMDELIAQFPLGLDQFARAAAQAAADAWPSTGPGTASDGPGGVCERLWDACRIQARMPMGRLAQRIESAASWDHLVLPPEQLAALREIAAHVRHRARVHDAWGFGDRFSRGLGVSALFAGPSGTGKTLAAEVLANDLRLDLYRIDLSQLVSKYIGETEKNLSAIFEAAERSGAILLFDEADALFGKRSNVKDSHDRYANIEVSYLLQRMESYRGLAVLTTNQRAALDQAFLRRLRFVVTFPFPDGAQRASIWTRIFPDGTPTDSLDVARLARLNVTGGNIRNIALHAAFLAAAARQPVGMAHLLRAARGECHKIEKPVTAAEIGGWA
jgi:hypothetical protein